MSQLLWRRRLDGDETGPGWGGDVQATHPRDSLWLLTVGCGLWLAPARLAWEELLVWGPAWKGVTSVPVGNAVSWGP